ncbi:MAG: tetraacyldisaccharide 4'-kinase [Paludibacteraceae bacterium]|nr:tetraacyldisaccharide 4'-kinase [Paludibacteraceae bacterium]
MNIRNFVYDRSWLQSKSFKLPVIVVGNLTAGGSGKTPHVELLLSILEDKYNTAMLSRGYKRKTKGFIMADETSSSQKIGDEPFQIMQKFPQATVAVCEKRVEGISRLIKTKPEIQVLILDDGFQHRALKPGLSILLTDYNQLYTRDRLLPAGRLRESSYSSLRADIIIVTKCPDDIKPIDLRVVETELNPMPYQSLFFSRTCYEPLKPVFEVASKTETLENIKSTNKKVLFVAGIVSPQHAVAKIQDYCREVETLIFPDHHQFGKQDFKKIENKFEEISQNDKVIITTEKDATRLVNNSDFPESLKPFIYYLPIKVSIINKEDIFIQKIKNYVAENTRNS